MRFKKISIFLLTVITAILMIGMFLNRTSIASSNRLYLVTAYSENGNQFLNARLIDPVSGTSLIRERPFQIDAPYIYSPDGKIRYK
jgi:hypothetical protein